MDTDKKRLYDEAGKIIWTLNNVGKDKQANVSDHELQHKNYFILSADILRKICDEIKRPFIVSQYNTTTVNFFLNTKINNHFALVGVSPVAAGGRTINTITTIYGWDMYDLHKKRRSITDVIYIDKSNADAAQSAIIDLIR
jgi:hypothetical protein